MSVSTADPSIDELLPGLCRLLLEQAFDLVAVVELPDLRPIFVSAAGRALLQYPPHGHPPDCHEAGFLAPATLLTAQIRGLHAVQEKRVWRSTGTLRTRLGTEIPARLTMAPLNAGTAMSRYGLLVGLDDSRFVNLQKVLRNEQLLLHAVMGSLPDTIHFKDHAGRYIRASSSLAARLGVATPEEMIGSTDEAYFSPEQAAQARAIEQEILATSKPDVDREEERIWPVGGRTWIANSRFPLRDWRGEIVGTLGISHDLSARKQAEAERLKIEKQLLQAQKMESIGRLASGVAHEINTPMQYVTDNTHFLIGATRQMAWVFSVYRTLLEAARSQPAMADAVQAVEEAEAEADLDCILNDVPSTLRETMDGITRISRIVQSLREFAHPGSPEKRPADLNHVLETAVAVTRHEWKLVADIAMDLDRELPLVPCVLDELNQVVLNLIINAAHAIGDVVAERPGDRGTITLRSRRENGFARFEIEDTGCGIPETARPHIFDPFFTTKPVGRGTGQGLAFVHSIVVKHHEGTVGFTTECGRGTTFWFRLPLAAAASNPAVQLAPRPTSTSPA